MGVQMGDYIGKTRFLVVGKKCCLREYPVGRYGNTLKRYEVFWLNEVGRTMMFPTDTPYYKEYGWDNLAEAKAFYLLNEI